MFGLFPLTRGIWKSQNGLRTVAEPVGVRISTVSSVTSLGTFGPYLDLLLGSFQSGLELAQS